MTAAGATTPEPLRDRIRCHAQMPDDVRLVAGVDVVLETPAQHILPAPAGTLLDDHFTAEERDAVDQETLSRLDAWRREHDAPLTVGNACLPWIWETELLAEVYLPVVRSVWGLTRVLERSEVRHVELVGADPEMAACLVRSLQAAQITVEVTGASAPPVPSYPTRRGDPWTRPRGVRLRQSLIRALGIPSCVRGQLFFLPYWNLLGLYEELLEEPGLTPIHDPFNVPAGPLGARLRAVAKGGWTGKPNAVQAARATRRVRRALADDARRGDPDDPLLELLAVRSRRLIAQRAGDTPAMVRIFERALGRRRVRGAVLPFDSPQLTRMALAACRAKRRPSVVIQHGFYAEPNDPDKAEADLAAVWSERDRAALAKRRPRSIVVTGNPVTDGLAPGRIAAPRDRTLIVTDYPSRQSAWPDVRITATQLEMMLAAVMQTRPGTSVLLRPHPSDWDLGGYQGLADRFPDLSIELDNKSPIDDVVARCDLCLAGVSTATLLAAMAGLPVVFVNPGGASRPWPFDGAADGLTMATTEAELVRAIPEALARRGQPAPEAVLQALGVRDDATARVVAAVRDLIEVGEPA